MTTGIEIRNADAADVDAVLALWADSRSAAASTADTPEVVGRLVTTSPRALLVAVEDGRIVGTLIAASDGWRGNMYRLAVAPDRRREGIAQALVAAAHERLRAQGIRRVTALVGADQAVAAALWRAVGYGHDSEIARFSRNL